MYDPLKIQEIKQKISVLFPDKHFYFFNAVGEDMAKEQAEIRRLITDCMSSGKFFIKQGNIEPIHHAEGERNMILEQMQSLLARCTQEMMEQKRLFTEQAGQVVSS